MTMGQNHEAIIAALFAHLLDTTDGFRTTGRRVQHWTQVTDQPALFLRHVGTADEVDRETFYTITTLETEAWVYCNGGKNAKAVPDTDLNIWVQQVRDSLAPDIDYGDPRFTLGGTVFWCRIEGKSDYAPGDQGGQAIARIPIRITLP